MTTERNHNEVALKKYKALKEFGRNRPNKEVAFQFKVLEVQFYLEKNKEKICEAFQNSLLKRQRIEVETYEKINDALLKWSTFMRGNNIPINGPILLEKAPEFDT